MHKMLLATVLVISLAGCSTARPDDTQAIQDQLRDIARQIETQTPFYPADTKTLRAHGGDSAL